MVKILPNRSLSKKTKIFSSGKKIFYSGMEGELSDLRELFIDVSALREKLFLKLKSNLINLKPSKDINPYLWHSSDLAENNLCLEKFSLTVVNLFIAIELINSNRVDYIICDDDEDTWIFSRLLTKNGFQIEARFSFFRIFLKYLQLFKIKMLMTIYSIGRRSYLLFKNIFGPKKTIDFKNVKVLIVNWFEENTLDDNKLLNSDRYFGSIIGEIEKKEKILVLAKPLNSSLKTFKDIEKKKFSTDIDICQPDEFLSYLMIFKAFFSSFLMVVFLRNKFFISKRDLTFLWNASVIKDMIKYRVGFAFETYYAMQKILTLVDKNIAIIYPFENQPWEKLLNLAYKDVSINNKVFAYQHFPIATNYITCLPSSKAKKDLIKPFIFASDRIWEKRLDLEGYRDVKFVGNARFLNHRNLKNTFAVAKLKKRFNSRIILCACSIQFQDSIELVSKSLRILKMSLSESLKKVNLYINFHPLMPLDQVNAIKKIVPEQGISLKYSEKGADQLLDDCLLTFYNSSSIGFNSAYYGVPPIFIPSNYQINLDKLSGYSISGGSEREIAVKVAELTCDFEMYKLTCHQSKHFFNNYNHKLDSELVCSKLLG